MDLALKTNKEDGEDETPLFDKPPYLATASSYMETDEDDDDDDLGSSSFADNQYSNMNIPSHLKNILTLDRSSRMEVNLDDDSDSDVESTSLTQRAAAEAGIDLEKLNAEIDRNKFTNFPLRPPTEDNEQEEEGGKTLKKTKKPREKKKRRDKGKKVATIDDDILFQADQAVKSKKLDSLFEKFAQDSASSGDEQTQRKFKTKSSSRKTRKKVSHEIQLDENGEQMMRTTDILDATSSESSEDERVLSKKQQMEMYREAERQRRAAKVVLKPVYNYKSFDTLAKRREEREQGVQHQEKVITHTAPPQPFTPPRPTATSRPVFNIELEGIDNDSDSDIEITGDPQKIARATQAAMLSPERPRVPVAISPVRHASTALRNHNRHMLYRITNEGYDYRVKMEQAAKARGQYLSATERARRLIEKEKNAMMINSQIERHFEKKQSLNSNNDDDNDDDEEDGDYEEQEKKRTYNDDILDDLSGSEEEEFLVEEAVETPNRIQKRKIMSDEGPLDNNEEEEDDDDDEEEQDMAAMAFKRWKGKKVKKSTFFDDDDEEEEQISKKKKVAAKPMPAHSISNFFKAKENGATEQAAESDENKALSRLVRRKDREPSVEPPAAEDDTMKEDAMDIDNPTPAPIFVKKSTTTVTALKGPREKMEYLEEEAEEEDDEFFGAGGSDGETGENLDEFEKDDLLVEDGNEHIDEAALREAFNLQDKETDSNMIQRLITDITSGNLRKQKAALESGLMLDDIDLYDEEDNDLVAIRRAAAARRRRLLKKQGGDILENLMSDPKTAAFAKAAQAVSDEVAIAVFSESEGEEEAEAETKKEDADAYDYEKSTPSVYTKRVIVEDDEDEEDEDEEEDQEMKDVSDDENLLIVDEFDTISSPLRGLPATTAGVAGGLASSIHITSADDDDVDFQIENMKSPVSIRKAKPLYGSPGTLERFKRLIAETNNALNGTSSDTGGPRVGFGSIQPKQQQQGESEGKPKLTGSLGEMFSQSNAKESKLKKLKSQSSSLFKYAE